MVFDNQNHADTLLEAECLIGDALMLCESMARAGCQMDDRQYIDAAAGSFGLMASALGKACELMSEAEIKFRSSRGLHYGENATQTATIPDKGNIDIINTAYDAYVRIWESRQLLAAVDELHFSLRDDSLEDSFSTYEMRRTYPIAKAALSSAIERAMSAEAILNGIQESPPTSSPTKAAM